MRRSPSALEGLVGFNEGDSCKYLVAKHSEDVMRSFDVGRHHLSERSFHRHGVGDNTQRSRLGNGEQGGK
jgi:hypothetical protein